MKNIKEPNAAKMNVTLKDELTHAERILNAVTAHELEDLFQEQEPELIIVLGKFRVTPMLYKLVAAQLDDITQNLMEEVAYTPEDLMGDEVWYSFGPEGQREMELCLKQFALNDRCPLVETGTGTFRHV